MSRPLDTRALIDAIVKGETAALHTDISTVAGFSRDQLEQLARQSQLVAAAFASGHISADDQKFFLDNLKELTRNFVNVLAGLVAIDVEKAWNAAVSAVWDAVGKAAGIALPKPF